ncbi:MAG: ATP-binding protein [Sphingomonadales bacterium]|nr:ATP-binding protein [Sphingomonadales bacterium]
MSDIDAKSDVDLTNCDTEPIHISGAVQPHAYFCAFLPDTHRICAVSENLAGVVGASPGDLIGRPATAIMVPAAAESVAAALGRQGDATSFEAKLGDGEDYWAHSYWTDDVLAIDLEPLGSGAATDTAVRRVTAEISRLRLSDDIEELIGAFADAAQSVLGFDRTMVYRFDGAFNGTVVAERSSDHAPGSFLGLTFPHSDIPAPARALFIRNRVRSIRRADYEVAEIVPALNPLTGAAFDLSDSTIRSVSPIHIEYLRNIDVKASFSISLIVDNQLWGLIACHHFQSERYVPPAVRASCILMCEAFSVRLSEINAKRRAARLTGKLRRINELQDRDIADKTLDQTAFLAAAGTEVLSILDADGVAIQMADFSTNLGLLPSDSRIEQVRSAARAALKTEPRAVLATDTIQSLDLDPAEDCAGILFFALPGGQGDILAVRREEPQPISWAGDPDKKVFADPETKRLHPRRSFELFRELRRGRSAPWPAETADIVPDLANMIYKILVRKAFEKKLENLVEALTESNTELERFAHVASHDLREPLRMIAGFNKLIADRCGESLNDDGQEYVRLTVDAATRMQQLIDDLLAYARLGQEGERVGVVDVDKIMSDVLENIGEAIADSRAEVTYGALPRVVGNDIRLTRLLQNLVGNGIKYQPPDRDPKVHVSAERDGADWVFSVRDNGMGIAEEYQAQIFEPFKRLHGKQEFSGTGIGLAICRKIVDGYGGRLWVASSVPGEGSVFKFTIPVRDEADLA